MQPKDSRVYDFELSSDRWWIFVHVLLLRRSNPLKDKYHGVHWQRVNSFTELETLPEDLVFYSACDVEPLLELYEITQTRIDTDFRPRFLEKARV